MTVRSLTSRLPQTPSFAFSLSWITNPLTPAYSYALILGIIGLFLSYVMLTGMTTTSIYSTRDLDSAITKAGNELAKSRIALTEAQHLMDREQAFQNGMVQIDSVSFVHNGPVIGVAQKL